MSQSPMKSELMPPEETQAIPELTRTYAQNRTLGVIVFLFIFLLLFAGIYGSSTLAGQAYRAGNMLLLGISLVVLVPSLAATVYLSVPRWGGKLQQRVIDRLYSKEGSVAFDAPSQRTNAGVMVLAVCFGIGVLASVLLGFVYEIPTKYTQPISALFCVPFLVGLWFLMRPSVGYAALLWPALYAAHAILILAGAPIVFAAPWDSLNMLIPVVGYGVLTGLVGHLHSRITLHRLKSLAQPGLADSPAEDGNGGD